MLAVLNDGVIYAFGTGHTVQLRGLGEAEWIDYCGEAPEFSNPIIRWRVKPASKKPTPFTRLTIPKNVIWRYGQLDHWLTVSRYLADGIVFDPQSHVTYEGLSELTEYSLDGGQSWRPGHDWIDS